jgi:hypothetical protein
MMKHLHTIKDFCREHSISRSFFYKLRREKKAPRITIIGGRRYISSEAAAEWRKSMEV